MADFKQFRNTTGELNVWLTKLYRIVLDLQRETLKTRGAKLDENTKVSISVPLNSLISSTSELRRLVDDQKENLSILKRTPPGMTSSIIDFIYGITVDPKAPSKKEEYQDKLRKLDRTVNKEFVSVSSALGVPDIAIEDKIHDQIESSMHKWTENKALKPNILAGTPEATNLENQIEFKTKYVVDLMLSRAPETFKAEIADLIQSFTQAFVDDKLAGAEFHNFIEELKNKLRQIVSPDHYKSLELGFSNILSTLANMQGGGPKQSADKSRKIYSQSTHSKGANSINTFKQYLQKLDIYFKDVENQKFIKQVDHLLGQISQKANKDDVDLAQKYFKFIKALFDPTDTPIGSSHGTKSIPFYLNTIRQSLEALIKTLEEKSVKSPEPDKIQPKVDKAPTETSPPSNDEKSSPPEEEIVGVPV